MIPDYDRAARMAYKTLLALYIESLPVDPLLILSHCKNTVIRTYEEITPLFGISDPEHFRYYVMNGKDALTVRRDFGGNIGYELFYYSRGNPLRRRFTLAHELGHVILKHAQEAPFEEKEADYYAAQLLAPHPIISQLPPDPDLIGRVFCLSRKAAEIAVKPPVHRTDTELYPQIKRLFMEAICPARNASA